MSTSPAGTPARTPLGAACGRREFLGAAAAAGALAAAAAGPLGRTLAVAAEADVVRSSGAPRAARALAGPAGEDDWHIDDMWGHAPRYAHPIPYSPLRTSPVEWEHVDPIDRLLVI